MSDNDDGSGAAGHQQNENADDQPAVQNVHAVTPRPVAGIKPPPPLLQISRDSWKTWRQMWQNYSVVSNLSAQTEAYKIALFLHTIGQKALEIYNGFDWGEDEQTLDLIIGKFNSYAIGEKNETYERYVYNRRNQQEGETFEEYLACLRVLAKTCNFCNCLRETLLRDRIVIGITSNYTRKRLLQERDLTLKKCIDMCKTAEATESQLRALRPDTAASAAATDVHGVHRRPNKSKYKQSSSVTRPKKSQYKHRSESAPRPRECKFCGRTHIMDRTKCPAWGTTCKTCGGINHFAECCKTKSKPKHTKGYVKSVEQYNESDTDTSYKEYDSDTDTSTDYIVNHLGLAVNTVNGSEVFAEMKILSTNELVKFQVDSGASVNIIPERYIDRETSLVITDRPNQTLQMWNKTTLDAVGTCRLKLRNPKNHKKYSVEFIVVKENLTPLLGNKVSQKMNLITVNEENFNRPKVATVDRPKSKIDIKPEERYAEVFDGTLGCLPGEVHLQIDQDVDPTILPPRRLPHAIKPKVKAELDKLVKTKVIEPVEEPTRWVSQLVVAEKKNGSLRICIDPRPLNKALKRPHYQLPVIDDILPELAQARVFSKLDLSSAFWQIKLDKESSTLTTFNTPFGRYRWCRLPFGTCASSEIFQHRIHTALEGLPGVICVADDLVVYGKGPNEQAANMDHDANLAKLLERCTEQQIKLNKEKSIFRATEIPFLGHLVTDKGLKPDPEKVSAVLSMPPPTDVQSVQRFVGFVNYLSRFLPSLSDALEPLRQLTKPEVPWHWTHNQQTALDTVKTLITQAPVLAYYNPKEELTIQCDASGKGLGAALLQNGRPIAYSSRALIDTETRYASIEKEMLAVVFSLERFHQYTFGRFTQIISDHKPLETIAKKPLFKAPKRLQGMLLRLQKYDYDIRYSPGKTMVIADTLSRAYLPNVTQKNVGFEEINMVSFLPIRDERLDQMRQETAMDETLQTLKKMIITGWPEERNQVPEQLTPYYSYRDELSVQDGLIFKADRVVVPQKLRKEMMTKIHSSHLGTDGCLRRARECLFWPHMTSDIKQYIATCDVCRTYEISQQKETLSSHELPTRAWERVGTDLFSWDGKDFLITVDYYSNFWEVDLLPDTTSATIVHRLKAHFARYGSPTQLISDNGSQYISETFRQFATDWDFEHLCSSPGNSQANGKAESAVKTAKRILTKSKKAGTDPFIAFLDHRNTPTQGLESSPAQRLMNRRTRTLLPTSASLLKPKIIDETANMKRRTNKQQENYNKTAKDLKPLDEGDVVRMKSLVQGQKTWQKAIVSRRLDERSYIVETPTAVYRRNRVHLRKTPEKPPETFARKQKTKTRQDTGQESRQATRPSQMHSQETKSKQDKPNKNNNKPDLSPKKLKAPEKTSLRDLLSQEPQPSQPQVPQPSQPQVPLPSKTPELQAPPSKDPDPELTTKSGRRIRPPSYLKDYVKN